MFNLALALIPPPGPDERRDAEEGFLGKLALWARRRIRYHRALDELHRLDDRDLDGPRPRARATSRSWPGGTRPAPSPSARPRRGS